jgi:hypothetical protein
VIQNVINKVKSQALEKIFVACKTNKGITYFYYINRNTIQCESLKKNNSTKPGVMVHICNPSTEETKAGGL